MRTVADGNAAPARWAIDELLHSYVSWREECRAVSQAYQWWTAADRAERGAAYAVYSAALEREEHAARTYARHSERVRRTAT
jgi:hypothetical protein